MWKELQLCGQHRNAYSPLRARRAAWLENTHFSFCNFSGTGWGYIGSSDIYMYIFARTHNHQYIGDVIYLLYCLVVIGIRVMVVFQTRLTGAFDSVKLKNMVTSICLLI